MFYRLLRVFTVKKHIFYFSVILVLLLILYLSSLYSYLFFHTLVELLSVIIALMVFMFAWNTRKISNNNYFLFIGITYFSVGIIDFFHTLSYKGMNIFTGINADYPTQLWIASRFLLGTSLFVGYIFLRRKINALFVLLIYLFVTLFILLSIFYWKIFPTSYIEGIGLTPFKKISEYFISVLFLLTITTLFRVKERFHKEVVRLLFFSFCLNILSELLFTLYVGVYDLFNLLGHLAKILSYYFVYKAIIEVGLTRPFNLLFLDLKRMEKRKDEFLNLASHELINPVTNIKIYAQILNKRLEKNKSNHDATLVAKINSQANKITSLINDLLDIGKIEAGKLTFKKTTFDLAELIKQIVLEHRYLSSKHKIIIKKSIKNKTTGDKERIGQVVINLISNAIKYSPEGGKIVVNLEKEDNKLVTSVQDFGIGISKDRQALIFNKYYRTEQGEKNAQGMGLGLYISKEIIKYHGGKIWVESEKDKGSTFYFTLPV